MMRLLAAALSAALITQSSGAPGLTSRLDAEIARVQADIARVGPADQREALAERLTRAQQAMAAGRLPLALYELEPAWEAADTAKFVAAHKDVVSIEAFRTLWTRTGKPQPAAADSAVRPALIEALATAAEARGPVTYLASLPFAGDAGVEAGLYYLGDAWASIHFASFVRTLDWPQPATPAALRSIAPELDAFDREVTAAYEKMDPSQHTGYIQTSDAIKEARTLDASAHYAGALLKYLVARYRFALLKASAAEPSPQSLNAARDALPAARDNGIAALFLDMADRALADSDPSTRRSAVIVLDDVLPAYAAATGAPPSTTTANQAPSVTITLVRWPFT